MVTQRLPPDRLFKYRSLAGPARGYLEDLLLSATVYFASPRDFNDPFDSRVHVVYPSPKSWYRKYLEDVFKRYRTDLNRDQRRALATQIVRAKRPHRNRLLQEAITADVQREVDQLGVFCLCEHPDDILMWSHYGDCHRGLCLQLETTTALGVPLDVAYAADFPRVDFLRDSNLRQVEANLLTKADRWAYEREWRIIDTQRGPGPRAFPPENLSGIIFGCRMPQTDRDQVRLWAQRGPCRPTFYEAIVRPESFAVDVIQC